MEEVTLVAVMVVVAVGLAAALLLVAGLRVVADLTEWSDVFVIGPLFTRAEHNSVEARLLFAEVSDDAFSVDGVVVAVPSGSTAETGTPLSLRFRRPGTWWFAECVAELLQGWAEADEVVELSVERSAAGPRATVSNGSSSVTLDLDDVHGLPAAA